MLVTGLEDDRPVKKKMTEQTARQEPEKNNIEGEKKKINRKENEVT